MKRARGMVVLAMLALFGCDDGASGCPGIGEHRSGLIRVQLLSIITSDCVADPTLNELQDGLISLPADSCEFVETSYQDDAMCDYAVRSVCSDSEFGWGFNARVFYVGDDTYEGEARFARSDLDGNIICSGDYRVQYVNIR